MTTITGGRARGHASQTIAAVSLSSRVTMRSLTVALQQSPVRRTLAGLLTLSFLGIFFALPLYAALSLCTMSCCGQEQSSAQTVSAPMGACATTCAIAADAAKPSAAATFAPDGRGSDRAVPAPVVIGFGVASIHTIDHATDSGDHARHRASDAPLHVLHSTFRI